MAINFERSVYQADCGKEFYSLAVLDRHVENCEVCIAAINARVQEHEQEIMDDMLSSLTVEEYFGQ